MQQLLRVFYMQPNDKRPENKTNHSMISLTATSSSATWLITLIEHTSMKKMVSTYGHMYRACKRHTYVTGFAEKGSYTHIQFFNFKGDVTQLVVYVYVWKDFPMTQLTVQPYWCIAVKKPWCFYSGTYTYHMP